MSEDSFEAPSEDEVEVKPVPSFAITRPTEEREIPVDDEGAVEACREMLIPEHPREPLTEREPSPSTECTFSPLTHRRLGKRRSPTEHYQELLAFEQRKQARLEQRRAQLQPDAPTFRPSLSRTSLRLVQSREGTVFERLQQSKPADSSTNEEKPSFVPKINARSQRLTRAGSIVERLYESTPIRQPPSPPNRSQSPLPASVDLAAHRFESELLQAAKDVPDPMNYTHLRAVLEKLYMLGNDRCLSYRVWSFLAKGRSDMLAFEDLKNFAMVVMGFGQGKVRDQFSELRVNRLAALKPQRTEPTPTRSRSTTPEAQRKSVQRLLAVNSEKKDAASHRKQQDELSECTFHPQLISSTPEKVPEGAGLASAYRRLLSLSKGSRHEKLHRLAAVIETRRLEVAPEVPSEPSPPAKKHRSLSQVTEVPKQAQATVNRLRSAREEAEWLRFRISKGCNNSAVTDRLRRKWKAERSASVSLW